MSNWLSSALGLVLGVLLSVGFFSLSSSPDASSDDPARKNTAIRLERDNQSLRQENQNLRNRLASLEGVDQQATTEDAVVSDLPEKAAYPESAAELGIYVAQLRKAWEAFSENFPDGRPSPDDERYDEFMAGFQKFASDFALIGVQMRDIIQYSPEDRGTFQASMIGEYLNLDDSSGQKLSSMMTDLNQQMTEAKLDWGNRPENRDEMRAWFENRRAFETEASKMIKSELPPHQQESYEQAFGERPLSGGMRDLMRNMGSMMRPGDGRQGRRPGGGEAPPPNG